MAQQNDLRERLLATLPQPENLAAYREETASLLAKHEKALATEKWATRVIAYCAIVPVILYNWLSSRGLDANANRTLLGIIGMLSFAAVITVVRSTAYENRVALLKEIKQVQLQILELQASSRKSE